MSDSSQSKPPPLDYQPNDSKPPFPTRPFVGGLAAGVVVLMAVYVLVDRMPNLFPLLLMIAFVEFFIGLAATGIFENRKAFFIGVMVAPLFAILVFATVCGLFFR